MNKFIELNRAIQILSDEHDAEYPTENDRYMATREALIQAAQATLEPVAIGDDIRQVYEILHPPPQGVRWNGDSYVMKAIIMQGNPHDCSEYCVRFQGFKDGLAFAYGEAAGAAPKSVSLSDVAEWDAAPVKTEYGDGMMQDGEQANFGWGMTRLCQLPQLPLRC